MVRRQVTRNDVLKELLAISKVVEITRAHKIGKRYIWLGGNEGSVSYYN